MVVGIVGSTSCAGAARCLVGTGRSARATIDRLFARGKLAGSLDAGNLWPAGAGYVAALHTYLSQHDYCGWAHTRPLGDSLASHR
jgi:hypothetical protein